MQIRDIDTGKIVADLPQEQGVESLVWHPDGYILAAVGGKEVCLWNSETWQPIRVLQVGKREGTVANFNHRGDLFLTNGWDCVLRVWDVRSGKQLFKTPSARVVPRLSNDDSFMATIESDGWRLMAVHQSDAYSSLAFTPEAAPRLTGIEDSTKSPVHYLTPVISPAGPGFGRLLAVATEVGVFMWDLETRRELGTIPVGATYGLTFDDSGALWTNGPGGVRRWPMRTDVNGTIEFGPPEILLPKGNKMQIACSANGRVAAIPNPKGALVIHREPDQKPQTVLLSGHHDVRYVSVSQDGRWVATGTHNETMVKIWDAHTGSCCRALPTTAAGVFFIPGNGDLFTSGAGGLIWDFASGELKSRQNAGGRLIQQVNFVNFAFSANGALLAEGIGDGIIRIRETATHRELANLQDPDRDDAEILAFSPDGTRLVTVGTGMQVLHVWDLQALARGLKETGLAWDIPVIERKAVATSTSLHVKVLMGTQNQ
jgi:WD40 repeat protein